MVKKSRPGINFFRFFIGERVNTHGNSVRFGFSLAFGIAPPEL